MEGKVGRQMTREKMLHANNMALDKAIMELNVLRARMKQGENKILADTTKMAQEGQKEAVKTMTTDLVKLILNSNKVLAMVVNLQVVSTQIQSLRSPFAMSETMRGVTKEMKKLNRKLKLPQIQKILQEFEKQSEIMGMKEEMMNDAMDDALGDEDDEGHSYTDVTQILDGIDLQLKDQLSGLPSASGNLANASLREPVATSGSDSDAKVLAEMLRKNKRALEKAVRKLDKVRAYIEQEEMEIIDDIQEKEKEGQTYAAKIMDDDLMQSMAISNRLLIMGVDMLAISTKLQSIRSPLAMSEVMRGVTKDMRDMNRQLKVPQIQKILQELEKESEIMDIKEEMTNHAMDDALGDAIDDQQSDAVVTQILDGFGLQLEDQLSGLPFASGNLTNPSQREPVRAGSWMIQSKFKMDMERLFGRGKTLDTIRKYKLALNKAIRDLDRERTFMEQSQMHDIDAIRSAEQIYLVKIYAKNIVYSRAYAKKINLMRAYIQAVAMKVQTLRSVTAMAEAMRDVTKAMRKMSRELRSSSIDKILQEFEKQSETIDVKEEIMNDAMDDALEYEYDEEKTDAIVTQVLNELGLRLKDPLSGLPSVSGNLANLSQREPVPVAAPFPKAAGHGRMMNPPARNTMWRFGFPSPVNYNDNELFCGGVKVHQIDNQGKCGLCGDEYKMSMPRPHETGGKFGNAIITRRYYSGQKISVRIELTSNHMGYFAFRVCPMNFYETECVGQEKMDRNTLLIRLQNGTVVPRFIIETTEKSSTFDMELLLPRALNCSRCALQWHYKTGNSWGVCEDGSEGLGCGPQETFINCADVSITPLPAASRYWLDPKLTSSPRSNPYRKYYRDQSRPGAPMTALAMRFQRCVAIDNTAKNPGMDETCQNRCMRYPPDCPPDTCKCVNDVKAIGLFAKRPMANQWCLDQCNVYPPKKCDETKCLVEYITWSAYQ
ncbi:unnamed protein product [Orchesella dallaii]|uniref:Chitin-binding type-4 domain-containing protein n=1 Tax=Orchesella dallaii TaxID=48710 RepID=A0ABP1R5X6_9HEXA